MLLEELSITVLDLYKRTGGRALPSNARIGIFTVICDDNCDANGTSCDGTYHFHGISVSLLQFQERDSQGIVRKRLLYSELSGEAKKLIIQKSSSIIWRSKISIYQ